MSAFGTAAGWASARARAWWSNPELRWLTLILIVAAALRIAWVVYASREPAGIHDPRFYWGFALAMADGKDYALPAAGAIEAGPSAYYPIAYPAALAGVFALVQHTPIPDNLTLAGTWFNAVLSVATVGFLYIVARRLFDTAVGLVAALWLALFPSLILHTGVLLTETLFNFLVIGAMALLLGVSWQEKRLGWVRLAAFGLIIGLATLVRPIALAFVPLLPLVWLFGGFGWRRTAYYTAVVTVAVVAIMTPWAVRNFIKMDAPVVIATNIGDNLCIGHHEGAKGHFALPPVCFAESDEYAGLPRNEFEVERNADNTRTALEFMRDHPRAEVRLVFQRLQFTWDHDHDAVFAVESYGSDPFLPKGLRTFLIRGSDIYFFVTLSVGPLGLAGFVIGRRDPRKVFFLLCFLAMAASPLPFFGDARFHIPALPFLTVAAAWMAVTAWRYAPNLIAQPEGSAAVVVSEREGAVSHEDALEDAEADEERDQ